MRRSTKEWIEYNKRLNLVRVPKNNRLTREEMEKLYKKAYPFEPTASKIGKFARQLGFRLVHQMINRKMHSFYVKQRFLFTEEDTQKEQAI